MSEHLYHRSCDDFTILPFLPNYAPLFPRSLASSLCLYQECSTEDIKRAYKKKSLELHPDKLAQRGQVLTPEDQARFQRVKEAYEVLVDPKRRDLYDEFGETGLKLIEDPQSMDPQTAFVNFMRSSSYDRCAIFMTIVGVTLFVLMWPVLLCLQVCACRGLSFSGPFLGMNRSLSCIYVGVCPSV